MSKKKRVKARRTRDVQTAQFQNRWPARLFMAAALTIIGICAAMLVFGAKQWHQALTEQQILDAARAPTEAKPAAAGADSYQPRQANLEFYALHLKRILEDEILKQRHSVPAVNECARYLTASLINRYGQIPQINLNEWPIDDQTLLGMKISGEKPSVELFIEEARNYRQKLASDNPETAEEIFSNEITLGLLQQLQLLLLRPPGQLTGEKKEALLVPAFTEITRRVLVPMVAAGCQFDEHSRLIHDKWLACGQDANSPVWHASLVEGYENAKVRKARLAAKAKYTDAQMNEYCAQYLEPVMTSFMQGDFPVPEISQTINDLHQQVNQMFGCDLSIIKGNQYFPGIKETPCFTTVQNGCPAVGFSLPALMDARARAVDLGDNQYDEKEKNSLATSFIHELIHLTNKAEAGQKMSFEEHIAEEKRAWTLTMQMAIVPLVEKYRLPLDESDMVYYRHWQQAGGDGHNPKWEEFIRTTYQKAGR